MAHTNIDSKYLTICHCCEQNERPLTIPSAYYLKDSVTENREKHYDSVCKVCAVRTLKFDRIEGSLVKELYEQ